MYPSWRGRGPAIRGDQHLSQTETSTGALAKPVQDRRIRVSTAPTLHLTQSINWLPFVTPPRARRRYIAASRLRPTAALVTYRSPPDRTCIPHDSGARPQPHRPVTIPVARYALTRGVRNPHARRRFTPRDVTTTFFFSFPPFCCSSLLFLGSTPLFLSLHPP